MFFFRNRQPQFPPPGPPPAGSFGPALKRVVVSAFLTLVAAVLTLGVGAIIMSEVWQFVSNLDEFKVDLGSSEMELPKWTSPAIERDLKRTTGLSGTRSIFEPGLGKRVGAAYSASPWVVRVNYIRRVFPNSMEVGLTLRAPLASVCVRDASYLVDAEGVLLSRRIYRSPAEAPALPSIVPLGRVAVCGPGMKWSDESVQAGVGLLRLLREYAIVETMKIVTIDVSNFGGVHDRKKSEIVLWNDSGSHVKWGRFASDKRPGEANDLVKLQNLLTVAKREGPALANIEYVDVRWENPYVMRKSDVAAIRATGSP